MSFEHNSNRLLPSILDRLIDEHPEREKDPGHQSTLSVSQLRESLLRDIGWLLNTTSLQAAIELKDYDEVQRSVINFGIPEFSGISASTLDTSQMEHALRIALLRFEPRIANNQLSVRVVASESRSNPNSLEFLIEGEIAAQPVPLGLHLKTEIDLENGNVLIKQTGR